MKRIRPLYGLAEGMQLGEVAAAIGITKTGVHATESRAIRKLWRMTLRPQRPEPELVAELARAIDDALAALERGERALLVGTRLRLRLATMCDSRPRRRRRRDSAVP